MNERRETLAAPAEALLEVKKSRHLARAAPVCSPEEALAFIAKVSDPAATHNCWAYRIGQTYRFSDDGEPAGTAGRPILAAIDGQRLDGVVVVVTRWFGGIKLGAGGLVRAYGAVAAEALRQAARKPLATLRRLRVEANFAHAQILHALAVASGAAKLGEHFDTNGLYLVLSLPEDAVPGFEARLRDATRGQARMTLDS
ncbi:MAG: hypothetical protein KatS3mg122_2210 [Caldimonas sp.]|nr:MAG: hypothetical protein KatS3mg122_2210 [Caldimonas sp.]